MKVISTTKDGYLVEMSYEEIRLLSENNHKRTSGGYYSHGSTADLGQNIDINNMTYQINNYRNSLDNITTIQIKLRKIADSIEPVKPFIEKLTTKEQ